MANDFQLHYRTVSNNSSCNLVPDGNTSIVNTAEVVVHAIYLTNDSDTSDNTVTLTVTNGANSDAIAYIFKDLEVPAGSTISIEKPINLPQSATATTTRNSRQKI